MQASTEIPAPGMYTNDLSRHGSTLGHDLHRNEQASLAIRKEAVAVLDLLLNATLQMEAVDLEALHYVQVCIFSLAEKTYTVKRCGACSCTPMLKMSFHQACSHLPLSASGLTVLLQSKVAIG